MRRRREFLLLCGSVVVAACDTPGEPERKQAQGALPKPGNGEPANGEPTSSSCDPVMAQVCQASCAVAVSEYDPADIVAQPGAKAGDLVRCPVSCVVVYAKDENRLQHAGQDYFVCCQGCAEIFRKEPTRFLTA
jgi:YHS domain-containing protein